MENETKYLRAIELFDQNQYEAAVELLIELYETGYQKELILQNLYDCFITPNEKEFQKNYEKNSEALCDDDYESLLLDFIPISDTKYYIFHKQLCRFLGSIDLSEEAAEGQEADIHSMLIADTWDFRMMIPYLQAKKWYSVYILLDEYEKEFLSFLKLPEIEERYLSNALIFRSLEMMKQFFLYYPQYYIPKQIISENKADYAGIMRELHQSRLNAENGNENVFLSICIPSYEKGSICLKNVQNLQQLMYDAEIEIVVSNDGSTEDAKGYDVIKNLKDSRITYFAFEESQGYGANMRKLLELAKGQFVVFVRDEDFMRTENFQDYLNFLLNHSSSGLLCARGNGSGFSKLQEGDYPAGVPALQKALEMNCLTGITLSRHWMQENRVLERVAGDSKFADQFMHCALAALTVEHTQVSISPVVLWNDLEEKNLSHIHYKSRIEQQNSVIEFIENVMQVSEDERCLLVKAQLMNSYRCCALAYEESAMEYKKLADWRKVCLFLHENNLSLLERWGKRLPESEIKSLLRFMENLFFEYTGMINPMRSVMTVSEQLDYSVVAGRAKDLFEEGTPIDEIDYPKLERQWNDERKLCDGMEDKLDLYFHKALNYKENILQQFAGIYQENGDESLLERIVELYYGSRRQEMQERYRKNARLLKDYPYFYGKIEASELRYYPLWMGEWKLWYYDRKEKSLNEYSRTEIAGPTDMVVLGYNILWPEDIDCLEKKTRKVNPYMDEENPLHLAYQPYIWELLMQLLDLQQFLELDRILFYNSPEQIKLPIMEDKRKSPQMVLGRELEEVVRILDDVSDEAAQQYEENKKRIQAYYKNNAESIIQRIKEGKPRIMFVTSRFSTAIQYHTRDCKRVAEQMGLQTALLIEPDRLGASWIDVHLYTKTVAELLPDIIFQIDHCRAEASGCLDGMDEVVFVCWLQDDMPYMFDKETPKKQKDRDIIVNAHFSWDRFLGHGYNEERLINYPMVANPEIYRPYQLSETELDKYACDVCLVCHKPEPVTYVKQMAELYGSVKDFVADVLHSYIAYVKETGQLLMKGEECLLFVKEFVKENYIGKRNPGIEAAIAHIMAYSLKNILYREQLADWLIDAGYTNLKLWGNGWADTEKYRPYAMGPAENGEVLAKINQAAKIVVGNNGSSTGAARVAETFLSGGFYLSPALPEGADTNNIRMYLKEDEDIICFHGKEDFLEKIEFYLTHEEERRKMTEAGHKKTMELLTYQSFMKNILKKIGDMF